LQANATREDYDETLRLAAAGGFLPDPYVVNARGNVRASLDDWAGAREDYSESARLFQGSKARGFSSLNERRNSFRICCCRCRCLHIQ
jgi:hypothetical protein